jgi:hypothetical protein
MLSLVRLHTELGRNWVIASLKDGDRVSNAILALDAFDRGALSVIAPPSIQIGGIESLNWMNQIPLGEPAWVLLADVIEDLTSAGGACLVVEDNIHGVDDPPGPFGSRSFLEDTIIDWIDLAGATGEDAVNVMGTSSTGYPLNAFVSTVPSHKLGLVHGKTAPARLGLAIKESLLAIIVSAFDGESYVFWTKQPTDTENRDRAGTDAGSGNRAPVEAMGPDPTRDEPVTAPCPQCREPMNAIRGSKLAVCRNCGFKDSCCY